MSSEKQRAERAKDKSDKKALDAIKGRAAAETSASRVAANDAKEVAGKQSAAETSASHAAATDATAERLKEEHDAKEVAGMNAAAETSASHLAAKEAAKAAKRRPTVDKPQQGSDDIAGDDVRRFVEMFLGEVSMFCCVVNINPLIP
jgi:hypothetical protein